MKSTCKVLCILLALITAVSSLTVLTGATVYDESFTLGDVNDDGVINALDSVALKEVITKCDVSYVENAADMNGDGKITSHDEYYLRCCLSEVKDISEMENGNQIYKMTIGGANLFSFHIAVPEGTDGDNDAVYTAADNLRLALRESTGFDPDITNDYSGNVIAFHVVESGFETDGFTISDIEDYYYRVGDGRIDVYGMKYRGLIYASYEIIESKLGFVWYSTGGPLIYKQRNVSIESGECSSHSMADSFSYRFVLQDLWEDGRYRADKYYLPRRMNGSQIGAWTQDKYGTMTGPLSLNAHSFDTYYMMSNGPEPSEEELAGLIEKETQKYINTGITPDENKIRTYVSLKYTLDNASNPNAKNDWQPCMTTDEMYYDLFNGMLDYMTMFQNERTNYNFLRTEEGLSWMSFSICDNGKYCDCRMCKNIALGGKLSRATANNLSWLEANYCGEYTYNEKEKTIQFSKESYSGLSVNMANRAAKDVQAVYPGLKIYMILYDQTVPETVRPDENLALMICGHPCANHKLTETCTDEVFLGGNNEKFKANLKEWVEIKKSAGCELYFWDYPIENGYTLSDTPNILNLYYDYKWLYEAGVDGIYYEGEGSGTLEYSFEKAKAYMATRMLWEPKMSYDRYVEYLKEYLYCLYGDGYEYLWQYIIMDDESGNAVPCFQNNHDRPFDEHSAQYFRENYEEMRSLCVNALALAKTDTQKKYCSYVLMVCDFLGLSACYNNMYIKGDEESRELYKTRYTDMYNYMVSIDVLLWDSDGVYVLPDEIDFEENPMIQFYSFGSWRYQNNNLYG